MRTDINFTLQILTPLFKKIKIIFYLFLKFEKLLHGFLLVLVITKDSIIRKLRHCFRCYEAFELLKEKGF